MPHSHDHDHEHAGPAHTHSPATLPAAQRIPASPLGTGIVTRLGIAGVAAGLLWLTVLWAIH